jgi:tRNA-splicing ligase RtcB
MKQPSGSATVRHWLAEPLPDDVAMAVERLVRTDDVQHVALMPDVHLSHDVCTGSRLAMLRAVAEVMSSRFRAHAEWNSVIHCNHNHVRLERHFGQELWVHRKGAVSAGDGEPGIIPGSMGTATFHVIGRGNEESLCSSSHGAGRRMSRSEARHRIGIDELERQLDGVWFDHRLAGQLRDEAPAAYKDIHAVMRAQRNLTRIARQCRPVLSFKGG